MERGFGDVLARAMMDRDPVRAVREAGHDMRFPAALRRALLAADEDGIRMTALLITRLRFERLIQGSVEAGAWFDRDPAGFAAAFRRYHHEVPPTAFFPPQEAQLFVEWQRKGVSPAAARAPRGHGGQRGGGAKRPR